MEQHPRRPRSARNTDGFSTPRVQPPRRLSALRSRSDAPAAEPVRRPAPTPASSTTNTRSLPSTPYSYDPKSSSSRTTDGSKKRGTVGKKPAKRWKRPVKIAGLLVALVVVGIGGMLGWKVYRNVAKITHDNNPLSLLQVFHPAPLKNQDGRVNILIAGDSVDRTDGQSGGQLTDSIMMLSIDTHNNTAFMLSIPRDLWVPLPQNNSLGSHQKINAAHEITTFNQSGFPSGGMGSLEYVIQQNLSIKTDYYALVNYTAFQDLVNALGGITVDIESPDPRGLYDPQPYPGSKSFKLANGVQTLNGQQALNLARARGDGYHSYGFPQSDFTRTQHQRQMVLAIKDKASSTAVIANPFKISGLLDAVGKNVTTDLKLNEIETLYSLTKKINDNDIASDNINTLNGTNTTLLANYTSPSGESALRPAAGIDDFSAIQLAIQKLFSSNQLVEEGASVVILNGGKTVGLAKAEGEILTAKGITVSAMADAPAQQTANSIIDNSAGKDPNTKAALTKLFGNNIVTNTALTKAYPSANFILILGTNQQMPAASTTTSGSAQSSTSGN